uniref:Uncharacterized protein n=1 Tax=Arundo donax TaxID=35708 RepID=A0A0A9E645_ARUDO
MITGLPKPQQH